MGKTLLQKPSTATAQKKISGVMEIAYQQKTTLTGLLQELDDKLADAAKDLIQPRQQAIDALLKKARSL